MPRTAAIRPPLSSTISKLSTVPSLSVSVRSTLSPISLSPSGLIDDDIAFGDDPAALAVPADPIGGEVIAFARHSHLARAVTTSASLS